MKATALFHSTFFLVDSGRAFRYVRIQGNDAEKCPELPLTTHTETQYFIEVSKREGLPDGRAAALWHSAHDLGIERLERFRVGKLYILCGRLSETTLNTLCSRLLCDPVAEVARVGQNELPSFEGKLTVKVTYHPGVTDAVADTVLAALDQLAIRGVNRVATGSLYHLYLKEVWPEETIRTLCERLLANPVIQSYEVFDPRGKRLLKG